MQRSKLFVGGFLGVMAFAIAAVGMSATAQDNPIAARQALMKENGGIMRGAGNLSGEEAAQALEKMAANFAALQTLFPEGSTGADSEALPVIWDNFDAFNSIFATDQQVATAAAAAARAGDVATLTARIKLIGGSCGECHRTYRQ